MTRCENLGAYNLVKELAIEDDMAFSNYLRIDHYLFKWYPKKYHHYHQYVSKKDLLLLYDICNRYNYINIKFVLLFFYFFFTKN